MNFFPKLTLISVFAKTVSGITKIIPSLNSSKLFAFLGSMVSVHFIEVLELALLNYVKNTWKKRSGLERHWIFRNDRYFKHTAKIMTEWLQKFKMNVLEWLSQSPDLNLFYSLWWWPESTVEIGWIESWMPEKNGMKKLQNIAIR